jgi:HEPN domain-containing protein
MSTSQKRKFKKEYAKDLLKIAEGDLKSSLVLSRSQDGRPENILFLAQQSVEKAIKALLVHQEIAFPLVHDLGILVALLPDPLIPPGGFDLIQLNPYASVRRCEEGALPLTSEEIHIALDMAEQVLVWVREKVER